MNEIITPSKLGLVIILPIIFGVIALISFILVRKYKKDKKSVIKVALILAGIITFMFPITNLAGHPVYGSGEVTQPFGLYLIIKILDDSANGIIYPLYYYFEPA